MGPHPHEPQIPSPEKKSDPDVLTRDQKSTPIAQSECETTTSLSPEKTRSNNNRKRHSIFGRSNAENSKQQTATLRSIMTSQPRLTEAASVLRSPANLSETRRRKTEPLNSIRHSLFGGRRRATNEADLERRCMSPPEHARRGSFSENDTAVALSDRAQFRSREDCKQNLNYNHIRKSSISLPFNFQHVTHTAKSQVPRLQSVEEKDLTAEFWSISTRQEPKSTLTGIKADDLADKHRKMGISRGSLSSRPTSPGSVISQASEPLPTSASMDEVMHDELQALVHGEISQTQCLDQHPSSEYPRRHSSMQYMNQEWPSPPPPSLSRQHRRSGQFGSSSGQRLPMRSKMKAGPLLDSMSEEPSESHAWNLPDSNFRARQPLPPLPVQTISAKASKTSLRSRSTTGTSSSRAAVRESSVPTKRSSRAIAMAPATESTLSQLTKSAWEDDIDFCYQQEAESTCNFDWISASPACDATSEGSIDGNQGSSIVATEASALASEGLVPLRSPKSCDALSFVSSGQQHKRGSSVGHRGFQAARNASTDAIAKSPALETTPELDYNPSVTGHVERESFKPPFAPGYVHLPGFESNGVEYLSDVESTQSASSRHRKSSSYGSSYDSGSKSAISASDSTRWSGTSSTSNPDVHHNQRKAKSAKSKLGKPLETLPQSPGIPSETCEEQSPIVPNSPTLCDPQTEGLLMRRPQTPGDRAVLQNAGRVVQRGRPATPNRFSRLLSPTTHGHDGSTWI